MSRDTRTDKKGRTEHNKDLAEANRQMEVIASRFIDDPEPFFEERKKVIAKAIEKYGDLQRTDLENGIISKKDYSLRLVNAVCKPFVPKKRHTPCAHGDNYYDDKRLLLGRDCYAVK